MLLRASAYIKVKGRWTYPYRAVDKTGQTIDLLSGFMPPF
jgi:transposase-like protein